MSRNILPGPNATAHVLHGQVVPSPMTSNWDQPKRRRKVTDVACEYCRKRRKRCSGDRPCANCQENNQKCTFGVKRKYAEVQHDRDELRELFCMISAKDSKRSTEIIERIRHGQDASTILKQIQHGDVMLQTALQSESHARRVLLSSLMQTSASFDDVVEFVAVSFGSGKNISLPDAALFRQLRGQQTDLSALRKLLGQPNPTRRITIRDLLSDERSSGAIVQQPTQKAITTYDEATPIAEPPFIVPAWPWTSITDDDGLVSHLVSTFLEWVNPCWRIVEEDLFVEAMRSGIESDYCSTFLVHSLLAFACLSSEREEVFVQTDDYVTRGQHFHDEALRLWQLEEGRVSLTNLQGLCLLFLGCVLRGKDKQGVNLVAVLTQLNRDVPRTLIRPHSSRQPTAQEVATYRRARRCAEWSAFICDMATSNTILEPAFHTTCLEVPIPPSELPKSRSIWTGYPLQNRPTYLDKNVLFFEACKLSQLLWQVQRLMYSSEREDPNFIRRVEALARKMIDWKTALPEEFQYGNRLPGPVFDLHAQYSSVLIALYSMFERLGDAQMPPGSPVPTHTSQETSTSSTVPPSSQDLAAARLREQALICAQDISAIMTDYRQTYGLKIILPYMIQANGVACFTLLQGLDSPDCQTAFKEAFRCLLGAGMQLLWARGMARMLHLTAQNTGIALPKAITTMLAAVADSAWTKSDTEMLSSRWPNYIIAKEARSGESVVMEDLIKKWEKMQIREELGEEELRK